MFLVQFEDRKFKETSTGKTTVIVNEQKEVKGGENSIVKILKKTVGGFSIVCGDHIVGVGGRAREGMYLFVFYFCVIPRRGGWMRWGRI